MTLIHTNHELARRCDNACGTHLARSGRHYDKSVFASFPTNHVMRAMQQIMMSRYEASHCSDMCHIEQFAGEILNLVVERNQTQPRSPGTKEFCIPASMLLHRIGRRQPATVARPSESFCPANRAFIVGLLAGRSMLYLFHVNGVCCPENRTAEGSASSSILGESAPEKCSSSCAKNY